MSCSQSSYLPYDTQVEIENQMQWNKISPKNKNRGEIESQDNGMYLDRSNMKRCLAVGIAFVNVDDELLVLLLLLDHGHLLALSQVNHRPLTTPYGQC